MNRPDVGWPITVGVADKQHAALAFAAEEARLSDCDLRVVHSYIVPPSPPHVMEAAYGFDIDASFQESGREVLADATGFLSSQYGDLTVHPVLEQGPAAMVLTGASVTSRLLVLGPDDASPWYSRLFQSRVSRRLVQDAQCPVVVVPDTWTPRHVAKGVTLLLDGQTVAHGPLRYAFEQASRHHDVLHVIHVDEPGGSPSGSPPREEMRRLVESWSATYPHVWVNSKQVAGKADLSMVESSERTGLLVLGRPHEKYQIASLHRSLARAVIEHADCPVVVVPADYDI